MTNYIDPPEAFSHMKFSPFADSIYYADLFKFGDTVWMITGAGKSKAARIVIDDDSDRDLGRDAVSLKLEKDYLFGRYDPGGELKNNDDLNQFYQIDFIAHCLTENQTNDLRHSSGQELNSVLEADNHLIANLLCHYPYPGYMVKDFFDADTCVKLRDPKRRYDRFLELTDKVINTKFILVPWADNLECKATFYEEFLRNDV